MHIPTVQLPRHQKIWPSPQTRITCIFLEHHYINWPSQCHQRSRDSAGDMCLGYGLKYQQTVIRLVARVWSFLFFSPLWQAMGSTLTPSQGIQEIFSGNITTREDSDRYCSLVFRLGRIVLVPSLLRILQAVTDTSTLRHWDHVSNLPFLNLSSTKSLLTAAAIPIIRFAKPHNCKIIDNMM